MAAARNRTSNRPKSSAIERLEHRRLLAATLIKDLNPADLGQFGEEIVEYNGDVYFEADDDLHGREFWKSDGTDEGTSLVKDLSPGPADTEVESLTRTEDLLFFIDRSDKLHRSDGTEAGTFELPGAPDPRAGLLGVGDTLFFATTGGGLWKTDGTPEGTVLVANTTGQIDHFVSLDGTLFFRVKTNSHHTLWRSDGTPEGTRPADPAHATTADFRHVTPAGGKLYFTTDAGGSNEDDLWVHDPATGQTTRLGRTGIGNISFGLSPMARLGDTLLFQAYSQETGWDMWRTDGTAAGTQRIHDANSQAMTTVGDRVYFFVATGAGHDLWVTDGTESGTGFVADVSDHFSRHRVSATAAGEDGAFYFTTIDNLTGPRVWRSDGTAAGTRVLVEMPPRSGVPNTPMTATPRGVFFLGDDGLTGPELWVTGGSPETTRLVRNINPVPAFSVPQRPVRVGDLVYFEANSGPTGPGLWVTDGTPDGTRFLRHFVSNWQIIGGAAGTAYIQAHDGVYGSELWATDGTPEGTRLLEPVAPDLFFPAVTDAGAAIGSRFYFGAKTDGNHHLWTSDGTAEGTHPLVPLPGEVREIINHDGRLLISAGGELWTSDGTAGGTTRLLASGVGSELVLHAGEVHFAATDAAAGQELWKTDGTIEGTVRVSDIHPGPTGSSPVGIRSVEDRLVFMAYDGVHGKEPWATDGTAEGTVLLKDVYAGALGSVPNGSVVPESAVIDGGVAFYRLSDGKGSGYDLLRTDGTPDGTFLLSLSPHYLSSLGSSHLTAVGDTLYFNDNGYDVWQTDGTQGGTRRADWHPVDEELPGPGPLFELNGELFISSGELYRLTPPQERVFTGGEGTDTWSVSFSAYYGFTVRHTSEAGAVKQQVIPYAAGFRFVGGGGDDRVSVSNDTKQGEIPFPIYFDGGDGIDAVGLGADVDLGGSFERLEVSVGALRSSLEVDEVSVAGTLTLAGGAGIRLTTGSVAIPTSGQAKLELQDNELLVRDGDHRAIEALVRASRNSFWGRWKGAGITSAAAIADPLTTVEVGVAGDDVLVKHTWNGDANLDGRVNADDYFRIDQGFLSQPTAPTFGQGDFNYDGRINADDYFLIDQAFLGQASSAARIARAAVVEESQERTSLFSRRRVSQPVRSTVRRAGR